MKKRLFLTIFFSCIMLCGCGKKGESDLLQDYINNVDKAKSYYVEGEMEIINNEDSYKYNVKVSYKDDNYFKVDLTNNSNNHQQVILRNDEGVYVVTPSLNKSFKFQSEWPYNNSQIYLLQMIGNDLNKDEGRTFEEKDGYYVWTSKVNYPNNKRLAKQVVYMDSNLKIKEVQVLTEDNNLAMKMIFNKIDMKAEFDKNYFSLNENIETILDENKIEETTKLEDVIYPMYLPVNTHLSEKTTVDKEKGERLILTFNGDSPFMLIEETVNYEDEHITIPTSGEPEILLGSIASVSSNSVNWISDGIEYYVISDVMKTEELLEVARSISVMPVGK